MISPWWLDFQKKYCIHEKCARASRIQNILAKVPKMTFSLSKVTKTSQKLSKLFTVWFPKELTIPRCRLFNLENQPPNFQHQISQRIFYGFQKILVFWKGLATCFATRVTTFQFGNNSRSPGSTSGNFRKTSGFLDKMSKQPVYQGPTSKCHSHVDKKSLTRYLTLWTR